MKKIFFTSIVFVTILLISYFFYFIPTNKDISSKIYLDKSEKMKELFREEVKKKYGKTDVLTYMLSEDKKIVEALIKKNSSLLNYENTLKQIEKLTDFRNLWIQIIDKNGYSFYRSWTNEVGDYVASGRLDVAEMMKNPRPLKGISVGRFDLTFKTMFPLFHNGEYIGLIEMVSKFNSIASTLKNQNIEPLMIAHENYTSNFIKPFSNLFIGNNYVANVNASEELIKKVEKNGIKKFLYIKNYILFENYLVTTDEIKDIHGGEMGFFILFFDQNNLDKSALTEFENQYLIEIAIFSIIYILIILYFLNRNYTKKLNLEVRRKTAVINEQKSKLESLLQIYDKNVIFSKTDLKGFITHASEAFCKISGFSKEELIGKPHNIVRHPDMPKDIFKKMWEKIPKEETVTFEIKNLRKEGSPYWVLADIGPEYDKNGKHIGYFAIREDITASKELEEVQRDIIFTMGSIAEFKSKETGEHIKRVAKYSKILALAYGLDETEASMIELASPMHDIGKIAISDDILNKPTRLTFEEFEIIKTHTQKGYEMLSVSSRPLLKMAATIAYSHHEKYDGTGYPLGLKGENIPLYGRITAIADVFDALSQDRCYKKAWHIDDILEYIKKEEGTYFDPVLVDLFFKNIDTILEIKEKYQDKN
ncbi:multi-sensor domain-containing response regulator c-di-GMP phosphodiesterase, RpfG family [Aliarcobacter cibarius]|jgi:PAS domain S-box-containing protein|uniref:HD domain-containing phosphohydrolase n=1 Tax=Aliarcobacter cibarius TaxID=255507 RepID=UPI00124920AA|nr:HD domain-containing phosphohydrolase [Aliarcobacter cibarius]QEZ89014.1 multi-sensor domain-containing response regulator c-di-GMP phosphodiesterase, RpfG family [Aliarcobacter cibarius]